MKLEIFAICDAATVAGGKLNVLGAFDAIHSAQTPVLHPQCAIALRLRFSRIEEGDHRVRLNLIDDDGKPIMPGIDGVISVKLNGDEESSVANFIINVHQLKFERAGSFSIDLAVDGRHECSLPLGVKLLANPEG